MATQEALDVLPRPRRYDERVRVMVGMSSGRVLHVGACGNVKPTPEQMPHFAQAALVDAGLSVYATDVNEDGIAWLRSFGHEAGYLDAERMDLDEQFDTIFAGELIEHLSNPGLFLDACARRLKPGGRLVLSTPQPFAPVHEILQVLRFGRWVNEEHVCWFDPQTLTQLLNRHGFAVDEMTFVDDLRGGATSLAGRLLLGVQRAARGRFSTTMVVSASLDAAATREVERYSATWR